MAGVALVVSAGWWVAAVQLTPAADRPYIGGSQNNSLLNLIFGYNGLGRLSGNESGSVGGGASGRVTLGTDRALRLFQTDMGGQISWLIPAALIVARGPPGLQLAGAADRPDPGGDVLVGRMAPRDGTGLQLRPGDHPSLLQRGPGPGRGSAGGYRDGHLVAPPTAAVSARGVLAVALAATAVWSFVLLSRSPTWLPWLRPVVLAVGLAVAVVMALAPAATGSGGRRARQWPAWAPPWPARRPMPSTRCGTPHAGAIPSAGPAVAGRHAGRTRGLRRCGGVRPDRWAAVSPAAGCLSPAPVDGPGSGTGFGGFPAGEPGRIRVDAGGRPGRGFPGGTRPGGAGGLAAGS